MTTLTQDQQTALDFYSEMVDQVKYFGLTILADREERLLFRQGKKLIETALNTKKVYETTWLPEEYDAVAAGYVRHGKNGYKKVIEEFRSISDRHSDNAIKLATYSCAHLDKTSGVYGMKDYAEGLLQALKSIDTDRFEGNRN